MQVETSRMETISLYKRLGLHHLANFAKKKTKRAYKSIFNNTSNKLSNFIPSINALNRIGLAKLIFITKA